MQKSTFHPAQCGYEHPKIELPEEVLPETKIEPPKCEKCGDLVRPGVVWFEENIPTNLLTQAVKSVEECDVMLIVGTSGCVAPVNLLPKLAIERNITTIQINLSETDLDTHIERGGMLIFSI